MVYCDCQVIFCDDFFDQVVGAIFGKIVSFSIKGQVVVTSPDITHTCKIRQTIHKNSTKPFVH